MATKKISKIFRSSLFFALGWTTVLLLTKWQQHSSSLSSSSVVEDLSTAHAQITGLLPKLKEGEPLPHDLFIKLGKLINPAVVNISTTYLPQQMMNPRQRFQDPFFELFEQFMGPRQTRPAQSLGTGFVIRADGLILTNNHVVESADVIKVQLDEKAKTLFDAKIIGRDPKTDVALIKIDTKKTLAVARLGSSADVQVGEWVAAFGNPYGHGHSMTKGIISAMGREIDEINLAPFIQTDASINPGNSGGPLVNTQGLVIGMNTAIDPRAQNIGFTIPIDYVKSILPQLEKEGGVRRGFIGIQMGEITEEIAAYLKLKSTDGALVVQVLPGNPAYAAGLKEYDIIVELNGQKIKAAKDVQKIIASTEIGHELNVKVLRGSRTLHFKIKVGQQDLDRRQVREGDFKKRNEGGQQAPFDLGFSVINYSHSLAQKFGLPPLRQPSPIVISVEIGSPAAEAGLAPGDVILDVNMQRIASVKDLFKALQKEQNILRVLKQDRVVMIQF